MNFWEIICVVARVLGIISMNFHYEGKPRKDFILYMIMVIFHEILSAVLILLPLYFVYWRR